MESHNADDASRLLTVDDMAVHLRNLIVNNLEFFQKSTTSLNATYFAVFNRLLEHILNIDPLMKKIQTAMPRFDFDSTLSGNGFRSLIQISNCCLLKIDEIISDISQNRDSMLFRLRASNVQKELEAYCNVLGQLRACLHYGDRMLEMKENDDLLSHEFEEIQSAIMEEVEQLNQEVFYGRTLGFQYHKSMRQPLTVVGMAMASFSESYDAFESEFARTASSFFHSGKYMFNPELRAKQVVDITRNADIRFCKAFWSLTEGQVAQHFPFIMCPKVNINKVITIESKTMTLPHVELPDGEIVINPPCANSGPGTVSVRLISSEIREGMAELNLASSDYEGFLPKKTLPRSKYLLLHCHGGGFVAQSSKSHEIYLRHWANWLNIPIVSIDYSLSPEEPFPRATEECFFAYAWVLNNARQLGWTGEKICLTGDSAGGNLMTSTVLRAISVKVRVPDALVAIYTPFLLTIAPSPSRMLSLMDPLLPVGILTRCLAAYAGVNFDKPPTSQSMPDMSNLAIIEESSPPSSPSSNGTFDELDLTSEQESSPAPVTSQEPSPAPVTSQEPSTAPVTSQEHAHPRKHMPLTRSMPVIHPQEASVVSLRRRQLRYFRNLPITKNMFMSPYLAPDELLAAFPPTCLMACHLDPLLDDSIAFGRHLRSVSRNPVSLELVDLLPHGFLNFSLVSDDAMAASKRCVKRIRETLGMPAADP